MCKCEITIILLTYNRAKLLRTCLESILKQKEIDFKVLIFDNCSNDDTFEVVKNIRKNQKDDIFYHRNSENIGFARNLKKALKYAKEKIKSKYIFTLSDDDRLAYNKVLFDLYNFIEKNPNCHIIRGGFVMWYKNRNFFERMFLHKDFTIVGPGESSIFKALSYNLGFYSGILVNQKYLNYNNCGEGLVDAFLYPFLKILQKKSFLYLPKITIIAKTGKNNLAYDIYNSNTDNTYEQNKILTKLFKRKYFIEPSVYELINYKIYCKSKKKIYIHYKYSVKLSNRCNKILFSTIYFTPCVILKILKSFALKNSRKRVMKELQKNHSYIFNN